MGMLEVLKRAESFLCLCPSVKFEVKTAEEVLIFLVGGIKNFF